MAEDLDKKCRSPIRFTIKLKQWDDGLTDVELVPISDPSPIYLKQVYLGGGCSELRIITDQREILRLELEREAYHLNNDQPDSTKYSS